MGWHRTLRPELANADHRRERTCWPMQGARFNIFGPKIVPLAKFDFRISLSQNVHHTIGFPNVESDIIMHETSAYFSCFQCFEDLQNVSNHPIHILIRSNSMTLSSSSSNLSLTKKMLIFVFQQYRIYRFANWAVSRSIMVSLDVLVWRLHALKCPKDL